MAEVTVREFSYNPSAMFARVQRGETIEVTKHGDVVAILVPPPRTQSGYDDLVARGLIKRRPPGAPKAGDWDEFVHVDVPDDVDPLAVLAEQCADRDVLEVLDEVGR
ncbi:MAG: type II toxin-antitoxin system Phd/YefM family antitoxin [Haloechinothrix sp.]